jgi:hypothetical protein
MLSIFVGSLLLLMVREPLFQDTILVSVFVMACCICGLFSPRSTVYAMLGIVAIVFLVLIVPFSSTATLYARLHDVALGGAVGVVVGLLVFPVRADEDFRKGVAPVLRAYMEYLRAIKAVFFKEPGAEAVAQKQKISVEKVLQSSQGHFPDWVYAYGFTPVLRQGHRHFLVRVEQLGEVLFAMHYIARHPIESTLLEKFRESVSFCVEEITLLMQAVIDVLDLKKPTAAVSDLSDEIAALEEVFRENTPVSLELLDTSQEYLDISAFIYDLKDLQTILLQLTKALR